MSDEEEYYEEEHGQEEEECEGEGEYCEEEVEYEEVEYEEEEHEEEEHEEEEHEEEVEEIEEEEEEEIDEEEEEEEFDEEEEEVDEEEAEEEDEIEAEEEEIDEGEEEEVEEDDEEGEEEVEEEIEEGDEELDEEEEETEEEEELYEEEAEEEEIDEEEGEEEVEGYEEDEEEEVEEEIEEEDEETAEEDDEVEEEETEEDDEEEEVDEEGAEEEEIDEEEEEEIEVEAEEEEEEEVDEGAAEEEDEEIDEEEEGVEDEEIQDEEVGEGEGEEIEVEEEIEVIVEEEEEEQEEEVVDAEGEQVEQQQQEFEGEDDEEEIEEEEEEEEVNEDEEEQAVDEEEEDVDEQAEEEVGERDEADLQDDANEGENEPSMQSVARKAKFSPKMGKGKGKAGKKNYLKDVMTITNALNSLQDGTSDGGDFLVSVMTTSVAQQVDRRGTEMLDSAVQDVMSSGQKPKQGKKLSSPTKPSTRQVAPTKGKQARSADGDLTGSVKTKKPTPVKSKVVPTNKGLTSTERKVTPKPKAILTTATKGKKTVPANKKTTRATKSQQEADVGVEMKGPGKVKRVAPVKTKAAGTRKGKTTMLPESNSIRSSRVSAVSLVRQVDVDIDVGNEGGGKRKGKKSTLVSAKTTASTTSVSGEYEEEVTGVKKGKEPTATKRRTTQSPRSLGSGAGSVKKQVQDDSVTRKSKGRKVAPSKGKISRVPNRTVSAGSTEDGDGGVNRPKVAKETVPTVTGPAKEKKGTIAKAKTTRDSRSTTSSVSSARKQRVDSGVVAGTNKKVIKSKENVTRAPKNSATTVGLVGKQGAGKGVAGTKSATTARPRPGSSPVKAKATGASRAKPGCQTQGDGKKGKLNRHPKMVKVQSSNSLVSDLSPTQSTPKLEDVGETPTKSIVRKTIVIEPDGTTVETIDYDDGSRVTSSTPVTRKHTQSSTHEDSDIESSTRSSKKRKKKIAPSTPKGKTTHSKPKCDGGSSHGSSRSTKSKQEPTESISSESQWRFEETRDGVFAITNDGADGLDGKKGADGSHGTVFGESGINGENATKASDGQDAGNMLISLSVLKQERCARVETVFSRSSGTEIARKSTEFPLAQFPTIFWSAFGGRGGRGGVGGSGGNGMEGKDGNDATPTAIGTDGQSGGNGGDGGNGSHGGKGGHGGRVTISIQESDVFLLRVLDGICGRNAGQHLAGGRGGRKGSHGSAGNGGPGGKGGANLIVKGKQKGFRKKQETTEVKGGLDGVRGEHGATPPTFLEDGSDGNDGSLTICVGGEDYPSVFDLKLVSLRATGLNMINDSMFEFGSVISLEDIEVRNCGGMPLPSGHHVSLSLAEPVDPLLKVLADREQPCAVNTSRKVAKQSVTGATGRMEFCSLNRISDLGGSDFDPVIRNISFQLSAHITDDGEEFSRRFDQFDRDLKQLTLRYPVENTTGIDGITSLCPEEPVKVNFVLKNVSSRDIGIESEGKRELKVRCYLESTQDGKVDPHAVEFGVCHVGPDPPESSEEVAMTEIGEDGQLVAVPILAANSSVEVATKVQFTDFVAPYSKVALQMEILLQDLPDPKSSKAPKPILTPIQRRQIVLTCEPSYLPSNDADVVIISSLSISYMMYTSLIDVLEEMGLKSETFSVSRYGSLQPDFVVENGMSLREAFSGKLVILLNDKFQPDRTSNEWFLPFYMLPPGALIGQAYDHSTTWLVIGEKGVSARKDLTLSHHHERRSPQLTFSDVAAFQSFVQSRTTKEASSGRVAPFHGSQVYEVSVKAKAGQGNNVARSLGDWLAKSDELRQYSLVHNPTKSAVEVYLEYCRVRNPGVFVTKATESNVGSQEMMLAVAEAMNPAMRVLKHSESIRRGAAETCLRAYRFASTADLTREVSYLLDGSIGLNDKEEDCFPSLGSYTDNIELLTLIRDCRQNPDLKGRTQRELSELIGCFEAVALSKDLRPRNPMARSSTRSMQETLLEATSRICRQWRFVMQNSQIDATKQRIKNDIKSMLVANPRADNNWMHGLAFLHSTDVTAKADTGIVSRRIIELDQGLSPRRFEGFKISRPVSIVLSAQPLQDERELKVRQYSKHEKIGDYIRSERQRLGFCCSKDDQGSE